MYFFSSQTKNATGITFLNKNPSTQPPQELKRTATVTVMIGSDAQTNTHSVHAPEEQHNYVNSFCLMLKGFKIWNILVKIIFTLYLHSKQVHSILTLAVFTKDYASDRSGDG